jgi:hypothetical protein
MKVEQRALVIQSKLFYHNPAKAREDFKRK